MKKLNKFLGWYQEVAKGHVQPHNSLEVVYETVNNNPLVVHTLKARSKEIKEKYNHKFNN
jgi:hypothetical protein